MFFFEYCVNQRLFFFKYCLLCVQYLREHKTRLSHVVLSSLKWPTRSRHFAERLLCSGACHRCAHTHVLSWVHGYFKEAERYSEGADCRWPGPARHSARRRQRKHNERRSAHRKGILEPGRKAQIHGKSRYFQKRRILSQPLVGLS